MRAYSVCNVFSLVLTSVVDPNTFNLDPDPGFWPNLDPDPDSTSTLKEKIRNNSREKLFA